MRELPGGIWYEPADTGFDNTPIAAAGTVIGNIVPWSAGFRFSRVVGFFEIVSGASVSFTIGWRSVDIDGQTILHGSFNIVGTIAADASFIYFGNDATPRASSGTAVANNIGSVIGAPYGEFRITNNDGVNAGNVSLRALLGE